MQHVLVVACSWVVRSLYQIASQFFYHTVPGQASYEKLLILSVFIFSPLVTDDFSEILSKQKDVDQPEFKFTPPFKKIHISQNSRPTRK